jgi:hypothetical protein
MNVSTDYVAPDLLVVNHKWGYPNLDPRAGMHDFILEDSCDSLFNNDSNLFLNDGIVTIISLSKVIGTLSGALVIFNQSSELEKKFRLLQNQNSILGKLQFLKKVFRILLPNVFKLPLQDEHANTFLTNIELAMIRKKLHKYRENYNLNESRIKKLNNIFGREFENRHRIGPGVVLKISNSTEFDENKVLPIGIIRRNFNFSNSNDAEGVYQKCIYVPIHGNISDVLFIEYLDFLAKHRDCLELS